MSQEKLLYINLEPENHPGSFRRMALYLDISDIDRLHISNYLQQLRSGEAKPEATVDNMLLDGRILETNISDSGLEMIFFDRNKKTTVSFTALSNFSDVSETFSALTSNSVITPQQAVAGLQVFTEHQTRLLHATASPAFVIDLGNRTEGPTLQDTLFENTAVGSENKKLGIKELLQDIEKGVAVSAHLLKQMQNGNLKNDSIALVLKSGDKAR